MRIATWNLAQPKSTDDSQADWLRQHVSAVDADVWVFTETHESFSPGPEYQCLAISEPAGDLAAPGFWTAIWSRIGGTHETRIGDIERTACARIPLTSNETLIVYGLVLPWQGSRWRDRSAKGGIAYAAALAEQAKDWATWRDEPNVNVCAAGDFNQDLVAWHYYGSGNGRSALTAAIRSAGLDCLSGGQRDPVNARYREHASINHICLSKRIAMMTRPAICWPSDEERGRQTSDHFGVAVDIEVTMQPA